MVSWHTCPTNSKSDIAQEKKTKKPLCIPKLRSYIYFVCPERHIAIIRLFYIHLIPLIWWAQSNPLRTGNDTKPAVTQPAWYRVLTAQKQ